MSAEQFREPAYRVLVRLPEYPLSGIGYAKYRAKKYAKYVQIDTLPTNEKLL